jgi:uroporphyrin-III C-methyltransferase
MVYGRAGEEILYFRSKGFEPIVVPGVTSAIAGPTFANIPVTQRGAAESMIVTTGVGRKGKDVQLPGYERGRTLVMLMGIARLASVVDAMLATENVNGRRDGDAFPPHVPVAIIERASMPDQRVIYSTLCDIKQALESNGEQRPPGMIVAGWAVLSLGSNDGAGDVGILDEGAVHDDNSRIRRWLGAERWKVVEGLDTRWTQL